MATAAIKEEEKKKELGCEIATWTRQMCDLRWTKRKNEMNGKLLNK